jgi:aspartyl aminopeptidase
MFRNNQKKKMIHKKGNIAFLSGFSKRDEEKVKNMIKEQPKIRDMINTNLQYRNDFLRSQRIISYDLEKSRLIGLEGGLVGAVRYYRPPAVRLEDFADAPDRMNQIINQQAVDIDD